MKQFLEIKEAHPEAILFFRVGDFYEMFYDDAIKASKILQIALTSRDKNNKNAIPLCGVPHHAASGYIARLIRAGESVAVCEQVEDPATAKGIVKREVVRVITPGTVIEPELLSEKEPNYLAALTWKPGQAIENTKSIGLACIDLSTGDFRMLAADAVWSDVAAELLKIAPKEILLSSREKTNEGQIVPLTAHRSSMLGDGSSRSSRSLTCGELTGEWPSRFVDPLFFSSEAAEAVLKSHFKVHSTAAFGGGAFSLAAAGALLAHLKQTQKQSLANITSLRPIPAHDLMRIHPLALKHLDLIPLSPNQKGGTLFHLLDETVTAMGGRLLKESILRPLLSIPAIQKKQEGVAFFHEQLTLRKGLRDLLKQVFDI